MIRVEAICPEALGERWVFDIRTALPMPDPLAATTLPETPAMGAAVAPGAVGAPAFPDSEDLFFETYGIDILRSLRRIIRAVDLHSKRLYAQHQVTGPQMVCLVTLKREGSLTVRELARAVSLSEATIIGVLDRLETKALARRRRCTRDRRRVYVELTPEGAALTRSAPALLQDRLTEALRRLPEPEQAEIARSLERVVELMEADHLDASPNLVLSPVTAEPTVEPG